MAVRLKNRGNAVHLYQPAGGAQSLYVEHGQVVEVAGDISAEIADAYIVGTGPQARAWPKKRWELDKPAPEKPAAPVRRESKED